MNGTIIKEFSMRKSSIFIKLLLVFFLPVIASLIIHYNEDVNKLVVSFSIRFFQIINLKPSPLLYNVVVYALGIILLILFLISLSYKFKIKSSIFERYKENRYILFLRLLIIIIILFLLTLLILLSFIIYNV